MFSREGPRRGPDEPRVEHGVRMASTARRPRIMYQRHEVLPGDVGQNRDERRNEFAGEHVVGLPHGERTSTAAAWYDALVEMQNARIFSQLYSWVELVRRVPTRRPIDVGSIR